MSFTTLIRPEQAIASPLQHTRNCDPIQQPVDGLFFGNPTAGYDSYYTSISGAMYPYLYRPGDCLPNYASQCFPGASPMYIFSHSQIMRPTGKCGIQRNPPTLAQLPYQTTVYPTIPSLHNDVGTFVQSYPLLDGCRKQEDSDVGLRSRLLEQFHEDQTRTWHLTDIFGYLNYVAEFSSDQKGSRFIQRELDTATDEERQVVFDGIVPQHTLNLMQDVFGNYVIQKLFEYGTPTQKTLLTDALRGHVLSLSFHKHGCRVVQKAIEHITPEQQSVLVEELSDDILRCAKDMNSNHVIQCAIKHVPPERIDFLEYFRGNVYALSKHPYGCRVLQRCFEHLPTTKTQPLFEELSKHIIHLMQDQCGNYTVQVALEQGPPHEQARLISKIRGQIVAMSGNKFASNVCEKALVVASPIDRRSLIKEMMTPKCGVNPILFMLKNQFANYVLQRALSVVEDDQKQALINIVKPYLASIQKYSSHGRHIIAVEQLLKKCSPSTVNAEQSQAENPTVTVASSLR